MEGTAKLNTITDFVSPLPKVPQFYNNLWRWGALILAIVATFTSLFTRIKIFIIRVRSIKRSASSKHLLQFLDGNDSDYTDDTSSTVSESDDDDDLFDSNHSSDRHGQNQFDDDFRVAGSNYFSRYRQNSNSKLRRRRSGLDLFALSEFVAGKSVVKLWDSLGLTSDFQDSSGSKISIWDLDRDQQVSSFFAGRRQIPAVTKSPPAVVYFSGNGDSDRFVLSAYDQRMRSEIPAVLADWGRLRGNVVGVSSGGGEKVYFHGTSDVVPGDLLVGDLRNATSPLNDLTESDVDTWWDAES